jgi:hypothetical protein
VSFVLLLTPTGSLPMGGVWRWLARVAVVAPVVGLATSALGPFDPPYRSVHNPLAVDVLTGPLTGQMVGRDSTLVVATGGAAPPGAPMTGLGQRVAAGD